MSILSFYHHLCWIWHRNHKLDYFTPDRKIYCGVNNTRKWDRAVMSIKPLVRVYKNAPLVNGLQDVTSATFPIRLKLMKGHDKFE